MGNSDLLGPLIIASYLSIRWQKTKMYNLGGRKGESTFLPETLHTLQEGIFDPQACLNIQPLELPSGPNTGQIQHDCSFQNAFQPCSVTKSAADLGKSDSPLRF